ncbi:MAG: aminotransferase class I/II-fold pyridoxal phosphate-dependent enzyme [Candidatus Omnitrophica bacterium]|nr:aminotransferase class I/II-fold pyridoxal phosphate-dependent enzyme [Candidatus Omnitrophota bacterium]
MKISKRVEKVAPSGIRVFFDLVLGMKDVISLGVGEPDFITPWGIREKAIYSLEQGYTSYTSNKGMIELREEISSFLKKRFGLEYDPEEEILITVGSSEAFDLAARTLTNSGDKILVPEPSYVSYFPLFYLAGGSPHYLKTTIDNGFKLTPQQIERACDKNTKVLVINYPANPTGTSYTRKELLEFAKIAKKRNLIVVSDEVYDELTYDFNHTPFATLPGMKQKTVYLNGFSKSYAMTGFRVGYACGPKNIINHMNKIHQYTMLCASIIAQMAAIEALKNGSKSVLQMKKEYQRRREYIVGELNRIGLRVHKPEGAFYVFPSIRNTGYSSMDFALNLIKKKKVAVVPGTAFGPSGEGYIRMAYASSLDNLKEAILRISEFLKR